MTTVHLAITGRVQGIGYRAFVARTAYQLRLDGWVRNRRDGSVEAVLAGDEAAVASALEELRRGPIGARVDNVVELPPEPCEASGFEVLPTM